MNERIQQFEKQCWETRQVTNDAHSWHTSFNTQKFAELIVRECANICMEMAAKCAGLPGDGALAKDCAYWIKEDFGVEE